ncbi:MAG TPA: metalloregulator ArsR/SmtB family transcription factor [Bacillota bacterium]|nr:metalloregulator ArsR/SmtB family transcription factor [Bacillota bacterium]HNT04252.1 metalloregulator ArsR/SmtB family transcription factor [Bacillota bacterium]HNU79847.1 metalloregulator ArsR/SmtB family transcription factor [Bacillota bacterium]HPA53536.1 metalloregulator ArsR/SmtB family transcription factor [Bacillota bacterium]HPW41776.1 metalloregulator ArsR/SmtB family transcription factor [Bacillota bacterium]
MEDVKKYEGIAEILKSMAHPVRICIIKGLMEKKCNVTHMQECLELPQSTVSQHLGVLRAKGIIKGERNGLEITYSVVNEDVKKIINAIFD